MNNLQKAALVVGVATSFITTFAGSALNLAVPGMSVEFNMGAASAGWIVNIYTLVVAALAVPCGKVADSLGRRTFLVFGIVGFAVFSVLVTFAPSTAILLILRALQAFAACFIFATGLPIAISPFPANRRGMVIGIVTAAVYCGLALGPSLGGFLNATFGWRAILYFATLICILALSVILKAVPKSEKKMDLQGMKLDIPGTLCYAAMISVLIYGLSSKPAIVPISMILGFIFVKLESSAKNPIIDIRLFKKDLVYSLSNLTALLNYMSTFALGYLTSIYLQVAMGFSSTVAGLVLMTQPLVQAIFSPMCGRLSDNHKASNIAAFGQAICTLSLFLYIFVGMRSPIWFIVAILAIAGLGIAFFSSPNTNVIMSRVDPADFGVANSLLSTMRTAGQSIGMAILTIVINITVGDISLYDIPTGDLTVTMHWAFGVFAALAGVGVACSLVRGKM